MIGESYVKSREINGKTKNNCLQCGCEQLFFEATEHAEHERFEVTNMGEAVEFQTNYHPSEWAVTLQCGECAGQFRCQFWSEVELSFSTAIERAFSEYEKSLEGLGRL